MECDYIEGFKQLEIERKESNRIFEDVYENKVIRD